ncbi:MAG: Gfo/Idh/MocA family oxidoreductase [Deltaproteobacteria bacterium]|nr:Gfo/Idh/MocA family oxidoreductase [Deltaproteobacteria bacterium]
MNRQNLGVAIVGSGRIGTLRANMASRHPSVRFLAVSDKDAERAGLLAESVSADLASSDNDVVISHPEVTAVVVSTPEHDHTDDYDCDLFHPDGPDPDPSVIGLSF